METNIEIGPRADISTVLLLRVADRFSLGEVLEHRDLGGTYNLNVYMLCSTGEFILRVYRPWVTSARLAFLQNLKKRLLIAGLPVPKPLGWDHGKQLGLSLDRLLEVENFTPSESISPNWETHYQSFRMLGCLHRAFRDILGIIEFVPPQVHNYDQPAQFLAWLGETKVEIARKPWSEDRQKALEVCKKAEAALNPIANWWEQSGRFLPKQLVHGDYGGENILWQAGKIVALLDFDLVDVHERLYDLAYTFFWLFERLEQRVAIENWPWERLPELLDAYQIGNGSRLSRKERDAFFVEMARVPLYWIVTAGFDPDPAITIHQHANNLARAAWLLKHHKDLQAYLP